MRRRSASGSVSLGPRPKSERASRRARALVAARERRRFAHEEHAPKIRERVCENLNYLGLELDQTANKTCKPDADVAMPASAARILVIATREDLTIMRETRQLVGSSISQPPRNEHALHQ